MQLYMAIGIPMLFNAGMLVLLLTQMNARFSASDANMNARFDAVDRRFAAVDQRFQDMRDMWRSDLQRIEGILDARLKHLEQR